MKNEKEIAKSNYEMLKSYAKEFIHHGMELQKALKKEKEIDAWVVAKAERATTDLSDITHYLDGKSEYAEGGNLKKGEIGNVYVYEFASQNDYEKNNVLKEMAFTDIQEASMFARKEYNQNKRKFVLFNIPTRQYFYVGLKELKFAKGGEVDERELRFQKENELLESVDKDYVIVIYNTKTKKNEILTSPDTFKTQRYRYTSLMNKGQLAGFEKIKIVQLQDLDFTYQYDGELFAKGGKLDKKATYVPKRDIAEVEVEKNGKTKFVDGADLLDGVYVKKSKFGKGGKTTTNSKQVRDAVKKHILESVYDENEKEFKNFDEASKYLAEEFKRVADHRNNQSKFPNNQDRFTDYLKGIPFHFEYTDEGLEKFLNGLGINPTNKEYTGDQMWKLYGALIWKEVYPKYSKYAEGGNINRSDSGELNGMYLDSLSAERKKEILTNIAKHYDISLEEANEEVRDSDAELLFEYTADNEKLSLTIYKEIEAMITTYAKGGQVSTYKKANWRFW